MTAGSATMATPMTIPLEMRMRRQVGLIIVYPSGRASLSYPKPADLSDGQTRPQRRSRGQSTCARRTLSNGPRASSLRGKRSGEHGASLTLEHPWGAQVARNQQGAPVVSSQAMAGRRVLQAAICRLPCLAPPSFSSASGHPFRDSLSLDARWLRILHVGKGNLLKSCGAGVPEIDFSEGAIFFARLRQLIEEGLNAVGCGCRDRRMSADWD